MDRGLTYTGNTGQQIALVPKARVALDVVANPRFQLSNRALQPFDMTFDLVRHRLMGLLKARSFLVTHSLEGIQAPDQGKQFPFLTGTWLPKPRLHCLAEAGNQPGILPVCLGSRQEPLGEGVNLRRVDDTYPVPLIVEEGRQCFQIRARGLHAGVDVVCVVASQPLQQSTMA